MSDTPAEIAAQLLYDWVNGELHSPEFELIEGRQAFKPLQESIAAVLEQQSERIRELEQEREAHFQLEEIVLKAKAERIAGLEQGLDAADDFIRGVYADLLGVPLADARSRNMQDVCVGVIDAIKTLEQANKELLDVLRAIPENLENVDWVRARYNAGIEWGVEWSEGTTDQSLGAFSPWKFCQNVASEIRAALSKHGEKR